MRRFKEEFWKTLSRTEKIEFTTVGIILSNLIVATGYIALDIL